MKKLTIAVFALLLLAGAVIAQNTPPAKDDDDVQWMMKRHPGMMGGPMGCGPMWMSDDDDDDHPMCGCLRGIDLTDDQEAKIEKARLDMQRKKVENRAVIVDLHTKLKLALTSDKTTDKEIADIAGKIGKFHQDAVKMHADFLREVRKNLTDKQRIEFDRNVLMSPGMGMGMGAGMGMGKGMKKGMCGPRGGGRCMGCE